jgi:hypothetical protein
MLGIIQNGLNLINNAFDYLSENAWPIIILVLAGYVLKEQGTSFFSFVIKINELTFLDLCVSQISLFSFPPPHVEFELE